MSRRSGEGAASCVFAGQGEGVGGSRRRRSGGGGRGGGGGKRMIGRTLRAALALYEAPLRAASIAPARQLPTNGSRGRRSMQFQRREGQRRLLTRAHAPIQPGSYDAEAAATAQRRATTRPTHCPAGE